MDEGEQAERRWRRATRRQRRLLTIAAAALCVVAGAVGFALAVGRPGPASKLAQPMTNPQGRFGPPGGGAAPLAPSTPTPSGGSPAASATPSGGSPAASATPSGTPSATVSGVRDGSLEFNVRAVLCGQDSVGNGGLVQHAAGDYCIVTVTVRNVGTQPVTLSDAAQQATTRAGGQFPVSWTASVASVNGSPLVTQPIAPGAQLETIMAFDVTEDATLNSLTLHGAPNSPGVTITVR